MKKILILLSIFYTYQAAAADFTDTLGAECSRILFALNEYKYPDNFEIINKRNMQFDYLDKCISLYEKTGGDVDTLNEKYLRAYTLYQLSIIQCADIKDKKKEEDCRQSTVNSFNEDCSSSSIELYNKYDMRYENVDKSDENSILYLAAKKAKDLTKNWFDYDLENISKMSEQAENEQNEQPKKGFFSWFK